MTTSPMLTRVLKAAIQRGASDVHAKAGDVFRARVDGKLVPLTKQRLTPQQTQALAAMFADMPTDDPRLSAMRDFDCSWGVAGVGRFRVNVSRQRSSFMMVLRVIPFSVPTPEALGLPDALTAFAEAPDGLVVIAGPSGSGKTSTMAALVHHINRSQQREVLTLEDPIEYLHRDLSSSVAQREVGTDTNGVAEGLQAAQRQDPDVIVISDLRDADAVERAIRAAESECLVLAAVSAPDLVSAVLQLVSTFPADAREVVRMRLAGALRAVVAQHLVTKGKGKRQLVVEWVEATAALRDAIAEGADAAGIKRAVDKAAKDGKADTGSSAG
jgi:twitching motility protein PilT